MDQRLVKHGYLTSRVVYHQRCEVYTRIPGRSGDQLAGLRRRHAGVLQRIDFSSHRIRYPGTSSFVGHGRRPCEPPL